MKWIVVRVLAYVAICAALVWVYLPARTDTPGDPYVVMVGNAIGLFLEANGAMPPTLFDVTPYLDQLARGKCSVTRMHGDSYMVEIPRSTGAARRVQVEYVSGLSGREEHYNAKAVD